MLTEVFTRLQFEGYHHWPNCNIDEVAYLKDLHRHIFYIEAGKIVNHDDRDVEFIVLKHRVQEYMWQLYPDKNMGATSCEMLAKKLVDKFDLSYCIVSEDNENGAKVSKATV